MSDHAMKPYTQGEFENELNDITGPYSITSKYAKLKKSLQKQDKDVVKKEAKDLKQEIEHNGSKGLSKGSNAFLNQLIQHGYLLQHDSTDPKSKTTIVHVENPSADSKAQVHRAVAKDTEKAAEMSQPGKSQQRQQAAMSKTVIQTGRQPSDPVQQTNLSATLPPTPTAKAEEIVAASGDKDKAEEFIRLINVYLESEAPVATDLKNHSGLDGVIKGIVKLKEEKKQIIEEKDAIVRTKDEQIKSLKDSQEKQAKTREDMERKYNDHFTQLTGENSKLKSDNEQLEESVKRLNAENHKVSTYAEQMQTNASKLDHNLRKVMEERDGLKQHISQLIEDNERQKHKLNAEIQRVNSENKQLKSRVSELAGAKLMDNNPDIADLSDPNRAMKLGEKFSSLYDDEWTDAFQTFTEKFNMKEDEAIDALLKILLKTYEYCRKVGDEQMDILCNVFENPCQDIPKVLTMKPQKDKITMSQKHHKELKDLRKKIALNQVDSIAKQYLAKELEEVKKGDKNLKKILEETKTYYEKCVEVCWPMVLHDPPVRMETKVPQGVKIDPSKYRLYGGNGDTLDYLVWPALMVEGGGFIAKGVAKPKKVPRTVKKP